jgi:hypothetical protein
MNGASGCIRPLPRYEDGTLEWYFWPKEGTLEWYAWPGGYPILYGDYWNEVLCPECAHKAESDDDERFRPHHAFIYYEGPTLYCRECNRDLESAYGDPDDNKRE